MDNITLPEESSSFIGQPLRITYKEQDYRVQILQKTVSKEDKEIKILQDGVAKTIICEGNQWRFAETNDDHHFAQAIWHAISLRYRL